MIAIIVVAMDGLNWFVHLANHRVRMLWRFHELHHSQEDMSVLTVFRTHPLIHVSYLLALIPGVVLLANGAASITVLVVYGGIVAFAHSNTRLGFGPLGRVLCESELSPHPPSTERTTRRQPGLRPFDLGSDLPLCGLPERSDRQDRHRTARTTAGGGAVHRAPATPLGSRGPARGAVPPDAPVGRSSVESPGVTAVWTTRRAPSAKEAIVLHSAQLCRRRSWRHGDGDGRVAPSSRARTLLAAVVSTRPAHSALDWALLVARIALAWIFIYYGGGKLFGWFNGPGIHGTALYFSQTAHLHPGGLFAVLGGLIEFGGGVALALGLCSRLAGVALFGDMVMAMITVTWATGINSRSNPPGYQLNLALGVLALVVALLGSGRFSLDALIERRVVSA